MFLRNFNLDFFRCSGMKKLKPSRYNIIFNENDDTIAFNSTNCAMAKVNSDFLDLLSDPNIETTTEKASLRENMYKVGFLVDENIDELDLLKLRQVRQNFDTNTLTVTILPTDTCNFSCFYCFENKKGIMMSDKIQEETIKFIESLLDRYKKLSICWFGGEPLLAANVVWSMSYKLMKIATEKSCDYSAFMISCKR